MSRLALFGQVGEFNPDNEKISSYMYLERVKMFLEANSVAGERKVVAY